jgi:hypothetical protein
VTAATGQKAISGLSSLERLLLHLLRRRQLRRSVGLRYAQAVCDEWSQRLHGMTFTGEQVGIRARGS